MTCLPRQRSWQASYHYATAILAAEATKDELPMAKSMGAVIWGLGFEMHTKVHSYVEESKFNVWRVTTMEWQSRHSLAVKENASPSIDVESRWTLQGKEASAPTMEGRI